MAKRVIVECDLSKQEYDPDLTVVITIKKTGKGKGRSYDLSPESAAKLEAQLVAGPKLNQDWSFVSTKNSVLNNNSAPKTFGDLDDSDIIEEKKAELKEAGILRTENEELESEVMAIEGGDANCRHLNKGRVQTTLRNGKRFAFKPCKNCHARVPEMTKAEKQGYMEGKVTGEDVNIREIERN